MSHWILEGCYLVEILNLYYNCKFNKKEERLNFPAEIWGGGLPVDTVKRGGGLPVDPVYRRPPSPVGL